MKVLSFCGLIEGVTYIHKTSGVDPRIVNGGGGGGHLWHMTLHERLELPSEGRHMCFPITFQDPRGTNIVGCTHVNRGIWKGCLLLNGCDYGAVGIDIGVTM